MSAKSSDVIKDTVLKTGDGMAQDDTSSLIKTLLAHKYDAWLGIITFLLILLYMVIFWLLCPCCKALKRVINNEVKITSDKLSKKLEKLEAKRQARHEHNSVYVPLQEAKY
nr:MAG: hypothetical protein [Wenzhou bat rhabdovirus 1]